MFIPWLLGFRPPLARVKFISGGGSVMPLGECLTTFCGLLGAVRSAHSIIYIFGFDATIVHFLCGLSCKKPFYRFLSSRRVFGSSLKTKKKEMWLWVVSVAAMFVAGTSAYDCPSFNTSFAATQTLVDFLSLEQVGTVSMTLENYQLDMTVQAAQHGSIELVALSLWATSEKFKSLYADGNVHLEQFDQTWRFTRAQTNVRVTAFVDECLCCNCYGSSVVGTLFVQLRDSDRTPRFATLRGFLIDDQTPTLGSFVYLNEMCEAYELMYVATYT
jgi:hypothetical protein